MAKARVTSAYGSSRPRKSAGKTPAKAGAKKESIWNREIEFSSAFGGQDKQRFFEMLAILMESGMSITESLEVVAEQLRKKQQQQIVAGILTDLNDGLSLSDAVGRQGKYFTTFEVFSLKMGEQAGQMNQVLRDLANYHEKRQKLRRKFIQAFSYPVVVTVIAGGVLFFMINFVVPMFRDIFDRFDAELPGVTKLVLAMSDFTGQYGMLILLVILATILGFFLVRKQAWFRRLGSTVMLGIPLIGPIIRKVQLSRFCFTMALLLRSRVNLDYALKLMEDIITFYPLQQTLGPIREDVTEGRTMYEAFSRHPIFPNVMKQMVRVGERTARMDDMMENLGKNLDDEAEAGIGTLTSLLEPILIVVLGLMVGIILVAMYLPMFELSSTVSA